MKIPQLYAVTRARKIAKVTLQRVVRYPKGKTVRAGRVYLYLIWRDGKRPRRAYLGQLVSKESAT